MLDTWKFNRVASDRGEVDHRDFPLASYPLSALALLPLAS